MHVRKGDTVQIISGRDKGMVGEVSLVRLAGAPAEDGILMCSMSFDSQGSAVLRAAAAVTCRFRQRLA